MIEHAPGHVFDHVPGQVVGHDARDRHVGQAWVGEDVIDTGAQREDRLEARQPVEGAVRMLPDDRIVDGLAIRLRDDVVFGRQQLFPELRVVAGNRKQDATARG